MLHVRFISLVAKSETIDCNCFFVQDSYHDNARFLSSTHWVLHSTCYMKCFPIKHCSLDIDFEIKHTQERLKRMNGDIEILQSHLRTYMYVIICLYHLSILNYLMINWSASSRLCKNMIINLLQNH